MPKKNSVHEDEMKIKLEHSNNYPICRNVEKNIGFAKLLLKSTHDVVLVPLHLWWE